MRRGYPWIVRVLPPGGSLSSFTSQWVTSIRGSSACAVRPWGTHLRLHRRTLPFRRSVGAGVRSRFRWGRRGPAWTRTRHSRPLRSEGVTNSHQTPLGSAAVYSSTVTFIVIFTVKCLSLLCRCPPSWVYLRSKNIVMGTLFVQFGWTCKLHGSADRELWASSILSRALRGEQYRIHAQTDRRWRGRVTHRFSSFLSLAWLRQMQKRPLSSLTLFEI